MAFTITTPLYYVNDKPHLGSTYTTIACDAYARYKRLQGEEVIFITGVDEHGQKIQRTAEGKSIKPIDHCNKISESYEQLWRKYKISNDRFIRTTSKNHKRIVEEFFNRVNEAGDIKMGRQKGWYCVGCEEYKEVNEDDENKFCPIHQKELEWRDEENLFFCLSKYQREIEELIQKDGFINPKSRKNEIENFVSNGLKDFSISRVKVEWGLAVPNNPGHTFYVWFDALVGYISSLLSEEEVLDEVKLKSSGWPASIHVIGKDILRFHAVYWPAMLLSAGLEVPEKIFGHGFLTREGQKMGKSLGNVLDPDSLLDKFGRDSVRWYLLREFEFGKDGDYQKQRFMDIINNDLANTIGNLLNRTISMSRKWFDNKTPVQNKSLQSYNKLKANVEVKVKEVLIALEGLEFKRAAEIIILFAKDSNLYLNDQEPWSKIKNEDYKDEVANVLYDVLEANRIIAILLLPLLPDLSKRMLDQLGYSSEIIQWERHLDWGGTVPSLELQKPSPVMTKIEDTDL